MTMTAAQAVERAIALAGSDDFGLGAWRDGLEKTLDAFARIPLTDTARTTAETKIVSDLAIRCRIEAWYRAHPAVEDEVIEGPILVCGMPRTGTTATVGMLALDPRFRFLRVWEALSPVPPPVAGEEDADPRLIAARAAAKNYDKPGMHIHDPDGPEEDVSLLSPLALRGFHGVLCMPDDYMAGWADTNYREVYAYHRRVLKLLQSRRGPRLWLLKAPPHLFHLDAFAHIFPNARFVMTHRDPAKVIPSVASLQWTMQAARAQPGAVDKVERGRHFLHFWRQGIDRGLAARARLGEDRFIDVTNDELVRDPVAVLVRVYAHLGLAVPAEFREKVAAYNARNAHSAGGGHYYTAEEYGLTRDEIRLTFADYIERFTL